MTYMSQCLDMHAWRSPHTIIHIDICVYTYIWKSPPYIHAYKYIYMYVCTQIHTYACMEKSAPIHIERDKEEQKSVYTSSNVLLSWSALISSFIASFHLLEYSHILAFLRVRGSLDLLKEFHEEMDHTFGLGASTMLIS